MLAVKVACPHCQAVLKTNRPLPAGQKVKCARCGASFLTGPERPTQSGTAEQMARSPQAARASTQVTQVHNNPPGNVQLPLRSTQPRGVNRKALAAIIVGGCLFVGAGVALVSFPWQAGRE
jgi:hypothetical protein